MVAPGAGVVVIGTLGQSAARLRKLFRSFAST
jgi:hypothetical protein